MDRNKIKWREEKNVNQARTVYVCVCHLMFVWFVVVVMGFENFFLNFEWRERELPTEKILPYVS